MESKKLTDVYVSYYKEDLKYAHITDPTGNIKIKVLRDVFMDQAAKYGEGPEAEIKAAQYFIDNRKELKL